jgi:flagellar biosynthesis anti-sigma factor FlgM
MRVDFTNFGVEPPENSKTGRSGQSGDSKNTASSSDSGASGIDQATFSHEPAKVETLKAEVLSQPDIREAKVQSLQQAIGNGEYSVLPGQIAEAIASDLGTGTGA